MPLAEWQNKFGQNSTPHDPWEAFHKEYPDATGTESFTRIGSSNDHMQAVFEELKSLSRIMIYPVKENNTWKIQEIARSPWIYVID